MTWGLEYARQWVWECQCYAWLYSAEKNDSPPLIEGRSAQRVCGRERTTGQALTDPLTTCWRGQKGSRPCAGPLRSDVKLQVLSATQRGVMRPHERRRRKRPLIAVHMCQIVAFACPGGGIGGCLWRRWANFCSHVLRMKKKHWAYLTLHFMDFPYGRISMHI